MFKPKEYLFRYGNGFGWISLKPLKNTLPIVLQLTNKAEQDLLPILEVEQTSGRLDLKERHLQELADIMKQYSPEKELVKQYQADAKEAADKARKYR